MNEEEFRTLLQEKKWRDEWWVAVDGAVLDGRLKLKEALSVKQQMPSRQVSLMHPQAVQSGGVDWKMLDLAQKHRAPAPTPTASSKASPSLKQSREVEDMRNQIRNINEDLKDVKDTYNEISGAMVEGFATVVERFEEQLREIEALTEQMEQLKLMFGQMIDLKKFKQQLDERQKMLKQQELRKEIVEESKDPARKSLAVKIDEDSKPLPPGLKLPGRVVGKRPGSSESPPPPPPPRKSLKLSDDS